MIIKPQSYNIPGKSTTNDATVNGKGKCQQCKVSFYAYNRLFLLKFEEYTNVKGIGHKFELVILGLYSYFTISFLLEPQTDHNYVLVQ